MKEKIEAFYIATLSEIIEGVSVNEINQVIKDFEEEELYEECAGIKKGLDLAKHKTLKEVKKEYNQLIGKRI